MIEFTHEKPMGCSINDYDSKKDLLLNIKVLFL